MKNTLIAVFTLVAYLPLHAQYYYKDIIGTREMNQMIKLYLDNKVSVVEATGFDGDGVKNSDFSETHNFFKDRNLLKMSNRNKTSITNQYYRFDGNGSVSSISDTSSAGISTTTYSYDSKNNPVLIINTVTDAEDSIYANEVHQWFYDAEGRPVRMLRILNNVDTTDVRFTLDDKGNVAEELPFIKKISRDKTYYYYDSKNRLTDIVRFNVKARRLLPDYMFEYSEKNQVVQKITTISTIGLGYLIWRYVFDERGLKTKEATFNRDKQMTGKIEYRYQLQL
ncbi:MAG: hypothetical protein E6H06_02130 [Bacteroidetes bacterium]|nr:MAG: hypothetical protein E6H06_02130 [Bacteroidota bacterium]